MKVLKRALVIIIIIVAAIYLFISWSLSGRVIFPESSFEKTKKTIENDWSRSYPEMIGQLPQGVPFEVETFDGLMLKGRYFKGDSTNCAIIMAHGWGETWHGMLKYVPAFDDCNCDFVFYDHRVHGESDGKYATGGINEAKDLLAVTNWVNRKTGYADDQIGWVGSSWGAATSIYAGVDDRTMAFIIADAPFQDWYSAVFERAIKEYGSGIKIISGGVMQVVNFRTGVDYKEASARNLVAEVDEPFLLIHSKADSATASFQSVNIAANMNKDNSRFYHTEFGNDHVRDVLNNTEDIRNIVSSFLKEFAPQMIEQESDTITIPQVFL